MGKRDGLRAHRALNQTSTTDPLSRGRGVRAAVGDQTG